MCVLCRLVTSSKIIVIDKADKGSTIVIQNKQDYIEQGLKHLSDTQTYQELDRDTTKEVADKVVKTVRSMYKMGS